MEQFPDDPSGEPDLPPEVVEVLENLMGVVGALRMLREGRYNVTSFAQAVNEAAVIAERTGDLEALDELGDGMITLQQYFQQQNYALLETLAASELPYTRGTGAWALESALKVDPKGTIAVWQKLLDDPSPKVVEAALLNYQHATVAEDREKLVITRKQKRALKPYVQQARKRLGQD